MPGPRSYNLSSRIIRTNNQSGASTGFDTGRKIWLTTSPFRNIRYWAYIGDEIEALQTLITISTTINDLVDDLLSYLKLRLETSKTTIHGLPTQSVIYSCPILEAGRDTVKEAMWLNKLIFLRKPLRKASSESNSAVGRTLCTCRPPPGTQERREGMAYLRLLHYLYETYPAQWSMQYEMEKNLHSDHHWERVGTAALREQWAWFPRINYVRRALMGGGCSDLVERICTLEPEPPVAGRSRAGRLSGQSLVPS